MEGVRVAAALVRLKWRDAGWGRLRTRAGRWDRSGSPGNEDTLTDQPTESRTDEDREDVSLACQGDQRAFERLYRRHVGRIYGLACRMAGRQAADDLTQDAFVRAWEKLDTFRGDARFGTWLFRLALNVIVEERRGAARQKVVQDEDGKAAANAAAVPQDRAFAVDFQAAVERLPEGARQVFVLHDVEGYMHREVASLVGITSGTSKGQLHRARMILRRYLRRPDVSGA
jgi:RNA polymerase sigma factor (sigma-70 family)